VSSETKLNEAIDHALEHRDVDALRGEYETGGRLLVIEDFLPADLLDAALADLQRVRTHVHRNYVPRQKKGGSVSRHSIDREAEMIGALYRSPPLRDFLEEISGARLLDCSADDPHTYALYLYTEPGDHIGWHYDTSFYRGRRFTLLLGLIENDSCRFECEINRRDDSIPTKSRSYGMKPGSLVFFDGEEALGPDITRNDGLFGSRALAAEMAREGELERVRALLLVDMVGDRDLHLTEDVTSSPALRQALAEEAARLGLGEVLRGGGSLRVIDDHTPFQQQGLDEVLALIDFQFGADSTPGPLWHTTGDDLQAVAAESLNSVGRLLVELLFAHWRRNNARRQGDDPRAVLTPGGCPLRNEGAHRALRVRISGSGVVDRLAG